MGSPFGQDQWEALVQNDIARFEEAYPFYSKMKFIWHGRCFACGDVLISKRDGLGRQQRRSLDREDLIQGRHRGVTPGPFFADFCISCFNKRRVVERANIEWNRTRLSINRLQREIYSAKDSNRDDRRPEGVSDKYDVGSAERRLDHRKGHRDCEGGTAGQRELLQRDQDQADRETDGRQAARSRPTAAEITGYSARRAP